MIDSIMLDSIDLFGAFTEVIYYITLKTTCILVHDTKLVAELYRSSEAK